MSIDKEVNDLQYNPEQILSFQGESITNFRPKEGRSENGKYIVVNKEKVSMQNKDSDLGIISSIAGMTYPGAMLLANRKLVENQPQPITVDRKPVKFSIDLPGMEENGLFTVKDPDYGTVNAAIQEKIEYWNDNLGKTHSIVARSNYSESMVYSQSELIVKFGASMESIGKSLDIDFESISKGEKSVFIAAFKQIFYTVTMAGLPKHPSDLVGKNVTWDDFTRFGTNNDNPPVFVSSVDYGRTIYVKMETSHTESDVEAAMKAAMKDAKASASTKYKKILDETNCTMVVIGGGTQTQDKIINLSDCSKIREAVSEQSEYDSNNPGYPISYTTNFLKDNSIAVINSTTDYIKTTTTEYDNATVKLVHSGGYVAQFKVTWDEVSYDKNGHKVVNKKSWGKNMTDLTAPFSTEITLQGNSENLCVYARECTGLAWEWWRTVFDKKNVALVSERTFKIYGTTLNQKYSISPGL
jgi:thiol-activated cytolysin